MKQKKISTLVFVLLGIFIVVVLMCIALILYLRVIRARRMSNTIEDEFHINLPDKFKTLYYDSITSIDSYDCYMVLKVNDEDYKLEYENQFYTEYAKYDTVDVFDKIQLAKKYHSNVIKEKDEKYFITDLENYDWYGYEYVRRSGNNVTVIRYVDVYIVHDTIEDILYVFYDVHQYPYNDQNN